VEVATQFVLYTPVLQVSVVETNFMA